jgi:HD domain
MKRRSLMQGLGALAFGAVAWSSDLISVNSPTQQKGPSSEPAMAPLPSSVAGIRLVDSNIARIATELSRTASQPYLFNHAVRTFLFGSLVGRARGQSFDEELLYLACILHDLGLTEQFEGDLPFEIQGAEAAKHFLEEHAYAKDRAAIVWDGIAMHPLFIAQFKQPEIALVAEGAGADVVGPDFSELKRADIDAVLKAFPRLRFKDAFVRTCANVVQKHPRSATRTFMRDVGERYVPEFHPRNFCDLVAKAPFAE